MSAYITTYCVVNDRNEYVGQEHTCLQEAVNAAQQHGNAAVVELEYEFVDSSLVWTPNAQSSWP